MYTYCYYILFLQVQDITDGNAYIKLGYTLQLIN